MTNLRVGGGGREDMGVGSVGFGFLVLLGFYECRKVLSVSQKQALGEEDEVSLRIVLL